MSAWGFGGFANGFLQGFNTMGQEFARRGLMRRERETSARDERRMALEEEIQRGNAQRADEEAALLNEQRQMNNDILRVQVPHAADAAQRTNRLGELAVEDAEFNAQHREDKYRVGMDEATASINHTKAGTDLTNAQAREYPANARSNRAAEHAAAGVNVAQAERLGIDNKAKKIELESLQKQQKAEASAAEALKAVEAGNATEAHIATLEPLIGTATTPNVRQSLALLGRAQQKMVESKGQYDPTTDPDVIKAMDEMLKDPLRKNVGMEIEGGKYRVMDTHLRGFERSKDGKPLMNPMLDVAVEPTEAFKAQQQAIIDDPKSTPEQKAQAQTMMQPKVLVKPLTKGRYAFEDVGEEGRMWLGPQDFQKLAMGYERLGQWQEDHPELVQKMQELKGRLATGKPLLQGKDKDQAEFELKVHDRNLKTLEHNEKRRGDTLKRIDAMLAKRFGQLTLDEAVQLGGPNAEKAYKLQLAATRILDEHPDWNEAKIMEAVDKEMGDKPSTPSPGQDATGKGNSSSDSNAKKQILQLWGQ